MIPRFKPFLGKEELLAALIPDAYAVEKFAAEFAKTFETKYALAFPYGRSALWAFFKAMDIKNSEIIMPAYTCSVVAHAIVLSGNRPRFVDITLMILTWTWITWPQPSTKTPMPSLPHICSATLWI